jgi:hypothetical protein
MAAYQSTMLPRERQTMPLSMLPVEKGEQRDQPSQFAFPREGDKR